MNSITIIIDTNVTPHLVSYIINHIPHHHLKLISFSRDKYKVTITTDIDWFSAVNALENLNYSMSVNSYSKETSVTLFLPIGKALKKYKQDHPDNILPMSDMWSPYMSQDDEINERAEKYDWDYMKEWLEDRHKSNLSQADILPYDVMEKIHEFLNEEYQKDEEEEKQYELSMEDLDKICGKDEEE